MRKLLVAALIACAPLAAAAQPAPAELPFSDVVRVGDLLFLSGEIGRKPGTTQLVKGGIGPETEQTLSNIDATLRRQGASLRDVVKCTVFMADMREWAALNRVWTTRFKKPYPARSALGVTGLALNARVEIECVAYAPRR